MDKQYRAQKKKLRGRGATRKVAEMLRRERKQGGREGRRKKCERMGWYIAEMVAEMLKFPRKEERKKEKEAEEGKERRGGRKGRRKKEEEK